MTIKEKIREQIRAEQETVTEPPQKCSEKLLSKSEDITFCIAPCADTTCMRNVEGDYYLSLPAWRPRSVADFGEVCADIWRVL